MKSTPSNYIHPVPRLLPALVSIALILGIFFTLLAAAFTGVGLVSW